MGKKKRQSQNSNSAVVDSTESETSIDSTQAADGNEVLCPHASKAVNLRLVKKSVKGNKDKNALKCCLTCKKNKSELCKDCWVCLFCGACNCGPEVEDHRQDHFKCPRSDIHYLVYQTNTSLVCCLKCQKELPNDVNKNVQSCVDILKKHYDPFGPPEMEISDGKMVNGMDSASFLKNESPTSQLFRNASPNKDTKPIMELPKVRGLMNLGNTCFFNSVLQCLAQTPGLVELLREMDVPGERFSLELDDVTISGVLEKHKSSELSEHLAQILTEVSGVAGVETGDSMKGHFSVNPRRLLDSLTSRCPQFEGGDQHDAHELLRHLLDSVHTEDLRRYQKAILNHIGYKKDLDELEEDKKTFGKKLNQKVCETIAIRPDQIFKGSLVSILQCEVCRHVSKRDEPFLDLSLPVAQDKPQPPGAKRKQNCNSPVEEEQNVEVVMSKHQMKKERKAARRGGKGKWSGHKKDESQGEPTIEEEDKKDSLNGEQSDADVEDNEDNGYEDQDHKTEIGESGYCSEKQMSARGSPVTTQSPEEEVKPRDQDFLEYHTCQPNPEAPNFLANRAESGLGSIQELTVTIPEEVNTECTSQDSVKVNASNGSSDSQHGNFRNVDSLLPEMHPPNDDSIDRRARIFEWDCTEGQSQDSSYVNLSLSQYGSEITISPKCSPKGSPVSGSHSNDNMSVCTSLPHSNDNMSTCNSLPENVSLLLNSPVKGQLSQREEASGSEERPESRMDCQKNRSSPVDLTDPTELNPGLLKLSLEEVTRCARETEDTDGVEEAINFTSVLDSKPAEPVVNDDPNGFVLVGGVTTTTPTTSKSPTPLPPPLPLFTTSYSFTHSEPNPQRNSSSYLRNKVEDGEFSLKSCLNQFTTIELLAGGNKVGCDACTEKINKGNKEGKTVYQVSTKQLLIAKLPPVMIFHLKRFQVQRFAFRKIVRHVDFPLVLDISPYCSVNTGPILYSLYAVVEHMGTLHGGHYVAYVKVRSHKEQQPGCPPPGKWYNISDSRVRDVDESTVLKTQAYLLFYERIL
ncbi:ubiquitin carboxyl-terminal hydrolase 45-like [Homalodisca vitripennis]|uniref:ubiquitin carboxyl-terminal hydrolase 45-like n=1 Tax=Homalodisca vitripennis TaxID=197043 RepID=UPI001EEB275E|nr:ubiquitin carboxyl-terminal hydrolase 45-like [Homalodisca vitripennis]